MCLIYSFMLFCVLRIIYIFMFKNLGVRTRIFLVSECVVIIWFGYGIILRKC